MHAQNRNVPELRSSNVHNYISICRATMTLTATFVHYFTSSCMKAITFPFPFFLVEAPLLMGLL